MQLSREAFFLNTEKDYKNQVLDFTNKYKKSEPQMFQYIDKQWLNGLFNTWQIWRSDPGFANTNSNLESFNATIKRDFTKRWKCSLAKAIEKLFEVIFYYSNDNNEANEFNVIPAFDLNLKEQALHLE